MRAEAPFASPDLGQYLAEHQVGSRMLFGGNLLRQPAFVQLRQGRPEASDWPSPRCPEQTN